MAKGKEKKVEVVVTDDKEGKDLTKVDWEQEASAAAGEVYDDTALTGGITKLRIVGAKNNC